MMAPSTKTSSANSKVTTPSEMSGVERNGQSNGRKSQLQDEDSAIVSKSPSKQGESYEAARSNYVTLLRNDVG